MPLYCYLIGILNWLLFHIQMSVEWCNLNIQKMKRWHQIYQLTAFIFPLKLVSPVLIPVGDIPFQVRDITYSNRWCVSPTFKQMVSPIQEELVILLIWIDWFTTLLINITCLIWVLSAASTEVTDEVKEGKDRLNEEQNSSVTEEVGYNSPLSDGIYIICTL